MNKDLYTLANCIHTSDDFAEEASGRFPDKKYKRSVLAAVRSEKQPAARKRLATAAACLAVIAAAAGIFRSEVQAAIEQIHYSISSALGLGNSAARYTEVVHTSVSSGGYIVTLQEALAAYGTLYVTYTVEREDGSPVMPENDYFQLDSKLLINGEPVRDSSGTSSGFLDDEKKIWRTLLSCGTEGIDLSSENTYELKLSDPQLAERGTWEFKFKADGSELYADTKTMALNDQYVLPDGVVVTLDELSLNKVEQRITFHLTNSTCIQYDDFQLEFKDDQGRTAVFQTGTCGNGKGILVNSYVPAKDSPIRTWIAEDAKTLYVTAYLTDMPETDGLNPDDYRVQTGETAVWDLTNLKSGIR